MFGYRGFSFLEIIKKKKKLFQFLKCYVRTRISDSLKTKEKEKGELPKIGSFHFWEAPHI
jgi:hypothetical protein